MSTLTRRVKVPRRAVAKTSQVAPQSLSKTSARTGSTPDEQFRPTSDSDNTTDSDEDSDDDEQRDLARGNQNPRPQRGTRRPLAAPAAPTKRKLAVPQEEPEEEYKDDALMQVLSLIVPRFDKTSPWPIRLVAAAMVGFVGIWVYSAVIIFSD